MLSRSYKWFLSIAAIIAVSGFLLYKYRMFFLLLIIKLFTFFDRPPGPTDIQMIEHFRKNEKSFDRLVCLWSFPEMGIDSLDKFHPLHSMSEVSLSFRAFFEKDTLYYYNLIPFRKQHDDIRMLARSDREKERDLLMGKLKIKGGTRLDPYHITNSLSFSFYYEGGPIKGFEYVYNRNEEPYEKIFIEAEKDLSRLIGSSKAFTLYKKIDGNWNLYITK